jgi:hypothetical protein
MKIELSIFTTVWQLRTISGIKIYSIAEEKKRE